MLLTALLILSAREDMRTRIVAGYVFCRRVQSVSMQLTIMRSLVCNVIMSREWFARMYVDVVGRGSWPELCQWSVLISLLMFVAVFVMIQRESGRGSTRGSKSADNPKREPHSVFPAKTHYEVVYQRLACSTKALQPPRWPHGQIMTGHRLLSSIWLSSA